MVGIPTADEFMKHKEEFDATIDNASDDLNAGLLPVDCCQVLTVCLSVRLWVCLEWWFKGYGAKLATDSQYFYYDIVTLGSLFTHAASVTKQFNLIFVKWRWYWVSLVRTLIVSEIVFLFL